MKCHVLNGPKKCHVLLDVTSEHMNVDGHGLADAWRAGVRAGVRRSGVLHYLQLEQDNRKQQVTTQLFC